MTTYTFTHTSRAFIIENSYLYLAGDALVSKDLIIQKSNLGGSVSVKSYKLITRNLLLAGALHTGRFSKQTFQHTSSPLILQRSVVRGKLIGTVLFPEIVPSQIQFKAPKYIVTEHYAQSGEVELQLWADSSSDASLQLDYSNVSDGVAETVMAVWDSVYGTYKSLRIPRTVLVGIDQALAEYILRAGYESRWFFAKVPEWEGRLKGYGDLKVSLIAKIDTVTVTKGGGMS